MIKKLLIALSCVVMLPVLFPIAAVICEKSGKDDVTKVALYLIATLNSLGIWWLLYVVFIK